MSRLGDKINDPACMVKVHFWGIWAWIAVAAVSWLTGWVNSTAFVSVLSIIALSLAHWSGYQGARAEQREKERDE
jgi:hypothetical protein